YSRINSPILPKSPLLTTSSNLAAISLASPIAVSSFSLLPSRVDLSVAQGKPLLACLNTPELAGVIRDTAGDHAIAYVAAGRMAIGAGVLTLGLRRAQAGGA